MSYTTGEIAKLCGVTVRTVQFYDTEGLLKPDELSEGGRRLYGEKSLKTLQIICMYRDLGLNLSDIKKIISDEKNCRKILLSVLSEREKAIDSELKERLAQKNGISIIKQHIAEGSAISPETFFDVRTIMKGKKKLKTIYCVLGVLAVLATVAEAVFIVLWAVNGLWLPFAIGMPCVVAVLCAMTVVLYKNTAYVCTDCGQKFRPKFWAFFFAPHTPKTRKLTCPHCGKRNYHTETYSD